MKLVEELRWYMNILTETDNINQGVSDNLGLIKGVFSSQGVDWVEPYLTTEGAINRREVGNHRGLYWIWPEINFYFGKAATNTVIGRHRTHRLKLDVNLSGLYGPPGEKKEPKNTFPEGWKEAVCKYIIGGCPQIPSHWEKATHPTDPNQKKWVKPGVLDFPVKHVVDVDKLPVLVWDLDHLDAKTISKLEDLINVTIWPYANSGTYRRRKQQNQ